MDSGQNDRFNLLKKFIQINFSALAVAHNNPGRYSQCWAKRFLGRSYGQLQAERKFPTSRCKRLWKT